MKDIIKIVIKGSSGYCLSYYAYNDKVTITEDSISYECKPYFEDSKVEAQKWSYKTTSPIFKEQYEIIASQIINELDKEQTEMWMDVGSLDIVVTFADKTKRKESYYVLGDYFHDLFMDIKELVPDTEYIPKVLKTEEDYEDEEYYGCDDDGI